MCEIYTPQSELLKLLFCKDKDKQDANISKVIQ